MHWLSRQATLDRGRLGLWGKVCSCSLGQLMFPLDPIKLAGATKMLSQTKDFSGRLSALLDLAGRGAASDLALKVGVDKGYLSNLRKGGKTNPSPLLSAKLAETIGVREEWLRDGKGGIQDPGRLTELVFSGDPNPPPTVDAHWVPIVSWVHAGRAESYEELPPHWQDRIPSVSRGQRNFGLIVEGDSMEPRVLSGDIAIVMPDEEPRANCLIVAKLRNDGVLLRRYGRTSNGRIRLTPYNPAYIATEHADDEFHWLFPVHSLVRREWVC